MMTIQQTRNAQIVIRKAIIITNHGVMKIENVVRMVNTAWDNAGQAYPLPYGEYKRRAWLLADLTRMQQQLADQLRDLEFAAGLPVDEETGADLREHSGNSIAADHAEAIEIEESEISNRRREAEFFGGMDFAARREAVEAAQTEALEVNAAFDQAVRQSEVFPDIETYDHLCTSRSVECIRKMLLEMNRYNARFILKMMIAVACNSKKARIAAKARYQEMLERCAKATDDQISKEIPF